MIRKSFCFLVLQCLSPIGLPGCGPAPTPILMPEFPRKGDELDAISRQQQILAGRPIEDAEFTADLEFHGYRFEARAGQTLEFEVTRRGSSTKLDTTLLLYAVEGDTFTLLDFDDDGGWGRLSKLRRTFAADRRAVLVVGTRYGVGRGRYRLVATCVAAACSAGGVAETPSAGQLRVASWNIETFPLSAASVAAVADEVTKLDADIVGVQEVRQPAAFGQLLERLPEYSGVLAEPGRYTRVGFIFRREAVVPIEVESLFVDDGYAFPRPALRLKALIASRTITLLNLHLKARVDARSQERRRRACRRLKAWLDARSEQAIVALGDWNDRIDDGEQDNVFSELLDDPLQYSFVTQPLAARGEFSYLPFPGLIDHILITDELRVAEDATIPRLDLKLSGYTTQVSDHLPVVTTLTTATPW